MDGRGPEGAGPKTGRKLGKCAKTEDEKKSTGELGVGRGKHYHNPEARGEGKRKNYDKPRQ